MRLCPNPSGSVVVFSRVGFDEGDEVLDARCRHRGVDYESGGCHHCKRYWREVLLRVVRYFSVGVRVHDKGAKRKEYGITVGCGPRRLAHANIAAGPSDVLDIELLPERFAEFLSGNPREDIGASARREWHNHAHCTRRIGFPESDARDGRQRGSAGGQTQKISAGKFQFDPPSHHSITSSAMASSPGGKLRPNALAVLRLITSSNLVDCMTGRSAGFSPLRIRPVYTPAWRYASVMLVP